MAPRQLNSGNLAHRAIAFAQWIAGQRDSRVIHVGIIGLAGDSLGAALEERAVRAGRRDGTEGAITLQ